MKTCKNCYYSSYKVIYHLNGKAKELYCDYRCIEKPAEVCEKHKKERKE